MKSEAVSHIRRPQCGQTQHQVPSVLRWADLQDKQSDGDSDDRIAKGDDPRRVALRAEWR